MKVKLNVIKFRYIALIPAVLILIAGLVCLFTVGFNKSIDFESGLSERIQIAPVGLTVSYSGPASALLSSDAGTLKLTIRSASGVSVTTYPASSYKSVAELATALNEVDGIKTTVVDGSLLTEELVSGSMLPATLSTTPQRLNFASVTRDVLTEDIRSALSSVEGVNVQIVGAASDGIFQIKLKTESGESQSQAEARVRTLLGNAFTEEQVVVLQSDFVGPKFSASLLASSLKAVLIAVVLILIYIWIRFRFAYALSSIIALVHDVLMMLSFILIFRLEVSSTTVAAVLTIIGYSLNNTIVIFDRVRENVSLMKGGKVDEIINTSVSQSLTRTIITTVTTLFAIVPLAIFGNGSIQIFAIDLTWGLLVGAYSSNFIAPSMLHWFHKLNAIDVVKKKDSNQHIHIGDAYV